MNGVTYSWDDNGNLLNDGAKSYSYDQANQLKQVVQGATVYTFGYNGVGDRLSQTVGAATTHYVLDPGAGLTQVLADGTNTYLYGNDRLAQYQTGMQYFGADGLGSVRQIYDASAAVVGSSRYDPFGNVMSQGGTATSVFAFAGEQRDATGLTYLRARYYSAAQGRFVTRDVWEGDPNAPMSYNAWNYVSSNPVNAVDPTGQWRWGLSSSIYHEIIEMYYERTPGGLFNPDKQLEYRIPGAGGAHADMFNSVSGDVYEIEPIGNEDEGFLQANRYSTALNRARAARTLNGYYGPIWYSWNAIYLPEFHPGYGGDWPGKMRKPLPYYPDVSLVADNTGDGLIVYWLERKSNVSETQDVSVPNARLLRPRNWVPVPVLVEEGLFLGMPDESGECPQYYYTALVRELLRGYGFLNSLRSIHIPPPSWEDVHDWATKRSTSTTVIPLFSFPWQFATP